MGFLTKFGAGPAYLRRYKDGLWAKYCRVRAGNVVRSSARRGYQRNVQGLPDNSATRPQRARLHSGETVLVNGASGITGIGTVLAALAMACA